MAIKYSTITDDFKQELDSITELVDTFDRPISGNPMVRISAANAASLLLAATFEEYVRVMAKEYAKEVVKSTGRFERLPGRLATRAGRRTMDTPARLRIDSAARFFSSEGVVLDPQARFDSIWAFCNGGLSRDIYDDLIFNENNMRVGEINSLFGVTGLSDVCRLACGRNPLVEHFGEDEEGKTHGYLGYLVNRIEGFFNRRNSIAHALNSGASSSPEDIGQDIDIFRALGQSLCEILESKQN